MGKVKVSMEKSLFSFSMIIDGTLSNPEMLEAAGKFGYTPEKVREGKALLDRCQVLSSERLKALGEQVEATGLAAKAWKEARAVYAVALEVARIAFAGNVQAETALVLGGQRERDFSGWLKQAELFYGNLPDNPAFLAAVEPYGWTRERLKNEYALVREAARRSTEQKNKTGATRKSVAVRDACFKELSAWVSSYRRIIRIALAKSPQSLEKLGIVV